jgi:pimeloyl-ACP methyl ester carboxylesterase
MSGFLSRLRAKPPAHHPAHPTVATPEAPKPYADRWWRAADGVRLHARDYGGGEGDAKVPVICLHGLTRNAADFEDLAPWIAAQGRRVLALDVRGRGKSAWDPEPFHYTPAVYASDVVQLIADAGIKKAVFVGTSMGGIVMMALAATRPELIEAAVLNDVGPRIEPQGLARIGGYIGEAHPVDTWAEAAGYAKATNGQAFPHYTHADWLAFAHRLFEPDPQAHGKLRLACDPAIAVPFRAAEGLPAGDMAPLFIALTVGRKSLLIHGETSDILDASIVTEMKLLAPSMDYAAIPGVGHAPSLSEPIARAAIKRLLDGAA